MSAVIKDLGKISRGPAAASSIFVCMYVCMESSPRLASNLGMLAYRIACWVAEIPIVVVNAGSGGSGCKVVCVVVSASVVNRIENCRAIVQNPKLFGPLPPYRL